MTNVDLDEIYAVPIRDRWLMFKPRARVSAMMNRAAVDSLRNSLAGGIAPVSGSLAGLRRWLAAGDAAAGASGAEPFPAGKLVIVPTRTCNMRCVYCDFGAAGDDGTTIDPRQACRFVEFMADSMAREGRGILGVHFFGGEPLIARDVVDTVVHHTRSLCSRLKIKPWFEVTTNAMIEPSYAGFVGDYFDAAVVSFDGLPDFHDRHRRNLDGSSSSGTVERTIRELSKYPVEICLRACITAESAGSMRGMVEFLSRNFAFDVLCFESLQANDECGASGVSAPGPFDFAKGFLEASDLGMRNGIRVINAQAQLAFPRSSSCPVGTGAVMLMPDGMVTACYLPAGRWLARGMDLTVGRVAPDGRVEIDRSKMQAIREQACEKPRCRRCFCRLSCAGGCHVSHTPPGCLPEYDGHCLQTRAITAGLLVRELSGEDALKELLENNEWMEQLSNNPDDRLSAWK
ncbi:MAG: hypothetical protein C0404_05330 [Verrucomicrobia bacterium]|nr:hypothetical protein [Verrucomicrobiota bacterium]